MADVKINPVFEGFSKQIGDLVFFQSNGKTFVKRKGNPGNPKTLKQMGVRNSLSELVRDWSSFDGIIPAGWQEWAKKKKMKGNNLFVSENFENQRAGLPIQLSKPIGNLKLTEFSAVAGSSGEITCQYTIKDGSAGKHIYFFTKKQVMNMAAGEITIHDGGADPSSPFTISALEPGAAYYIYAVITNADYDNATEVSASAGVTASSGV